MPISQTTADLIEGKTIKKVTFMQGGTIEFKLKGGGSIRIFASAPHQAEPILHITVRNRLGTVVSSKIVNRWDPSKQTLREPSFAAAMGKPKGKAPQKQHV